MDEGGVDPSDRDPLIPHTDDGDDDDDTNPFQPESASTSEPGGEMSRPQERDPHHADTSSSRVLLQGDWLQIL